MSNKKNKQGLQTKHNLMKAYTALEKEHQERNPNSSRKTVTARSPEKYETCQGFFTEIRYHTNSQGPNVVIVSEAIARKIYSLQISVKEGVPNYSLKQSGYPQEGRGQITETQKFYELYGANWMTQDSRNELEGIKDTIEQRKRPIEGHLEIEVKI